MNRPDRAATVRTTLCGGCAFIVAMSISRFAYTPILPRMIAASAVDHTEGALLASANLLAYLAGAFAATLPQLRVRPVLTLRFALALNVLTLLSMALPHAHAVWMLSRLLSGVSSAVIFVFASTLVLALRNTAAATALFASVGGGIALTGTMLPPVYARWPSWSAGWIACAIAGGLLGAIAALAARPAQPENMDGSTPSASTSGPRVGFIATVTAYGLAGFSYVIPATFLVTIMSSQPMLRPYASLSWIVVGVVASLSTVAWSGLSGRFGKPRMLMCALLILAIGCAGPVVFPNAFGALLGATGLGASFMAISMLSLAIVREIDPDRASTRIAQATAVFGIGQVVGPVFVAYTYRVSGSYAASLLTAAAAMLLALAIVWAGTIRVPEWKGKVC